MHKRIIFIMLIFFYFFFVVTIHSFAKTPTGGQSYTVVDSIEEGTTFNLQYIPNNNSVKLHVCSVLNEDYIRNELSSNTPLKFNLIVYGDKYIDNNGIKYRKYETDLTVFSNVGENISSYFSTCSWDNNNLNFALRNDLNCKVKENISVVINVIDGYKYNLLCSNGVSESGITSTEYTINFSYDQCISGCWISYQNIEVPNMNPNVVQYPSYTPYTPRDKIKPTVTGVKNNKTYKKQVTIKFSDKQSGIKKATLNGKKIKSGKKVKKNGKYTLKVHDKAGNVKQVKFTIKIKKK